MATVAAPFLAFVIGALVYGFAGNPKLARLGEMLAFVGMLWTIYVLSSVHIRF